MWLPTQSILIFRPLFFHSSISEQITIHNVMGWGSLWISDQTFMTTYMSVRTQDLCETISIRISQMTTFVDKWQSCRFLRKLMIKYDLILIEVQFSHVLYIILHTKDLPHDQNALLCVSLFLPERLLKRNTPKISSVCPRRCADTMRWSKRPQRWDATYVCV